MLKVFGINGSPRSGWNTRMMVKRALEGAASVGAQTKMINLGKLNFDPCVSCLVCKKGPEYQGKCAHKDDLTPILEELKEADAIVLGTPIYFSKECALYHSFWERFAFSNSIYGKTYADCRIYPKNIKSAVLFTMNVPPELAQAYEPLFERIKNETISMLGPDCKTYAAMNTLQVKDYSKYDIKLFDAESKYKSRKEQFPLDLEEAYKIGKWLGMK